MKKISFTTEEESELHEELISPTLPPKKTKLIFYLFCLLYLISYSTVSLIAPFYPDVAKSRGIGETLIGLIFSLETLASAIFSALIGKKMNAFGKKSILIIGMLLSIVGTFIFGTLIHVTNREAFLVLSIVARVLQGFGLCIAAVVCLGYIPILYPDDVTEKVGYLEGGGSIGVISGPLIGSATYYLFGYEAPFYTISIILFIFMIFLIVAIPNDKRKTKDPEKVWGYLKHPKILACTMAIMLSGVALTYLDPILAFHLHDYGIEHSSQVALYFVIYDVSYTLLALNIEKVTTKIGNKPVIFLGLIFLGIGSLLVGPDPRLFFLPRHISCIIVGLVLIGFGCAAALLPAFEEMYDLVEETDSKLDKKTISAVVSSFFTFFYTFGEFIGPMVGGSISEHINFETAAGIIAILMLFGGTLYAIHWKLIKSDEKDRSLENSESNESLVKGKENEDYKETVVPEEIVEEK